MMRARCLLVAIVLILSACENRASDYCRELRSRLTDREVQDYLIDWVDKNIVDRPFSEGDIAVSGGIYPGYHWLPDAQVDWKKLGFREQAQVRFVGAPYDATSTRLSEVTKSIFFAERSRKGVLIRMPHVSEFGVDVSKIEVISGRVAVYCMQDK